MTEKQVEALIRENYQALRRYCLYLKLSVHDAEDVAAETFKRIRNG